jgi:hypothetical protein
MPFFRSLACCSITSHRSARVFSRWSALFWCQNNADQREKTRADRWEVIEQQAKDRKNGIPPPPFLGIGILLQFQGVQPPLTLVGHGLYLIDRLRHVKGPIDEVEAMTHESQRRLNSLKLQEDSDSKERPSREVQFQGVQPPLTLVGHGLYLIDRLRHVKGGGWWWGNGSTRNSSMNALMITPSTRTTQTNAKRLARTGGR